LDIRKSYHTFSEELLKIIKAVEKLKEDLIKDLIEAKKII